MRKISLPLVTLVFAIWFCAIAIYSFATEQPTTNLTVISGVRLIDGTGQPPKENVDLVLQADKIRDIVKTGSQSYPKGTRIVDARGKTVMPALINAHGHLGLLKGTQMAATNYTKENILRQLKHYEAYGVDTVVSLGTDQDQIYQLRDEQRQATLPGARILTAGQGFGVAGGNPPLKMGTVEVYRPDSVQKARADVRELATHHPDILKIWLDDNFHKVPEMKPGIYQAIVDEAHRLKLRVAAHVFYLEDAKSLVKSGVDVLAHSIRNRSVDQELIAAMRQKNVFLIPTLTLDQSHYIYAEQPSWMKDSFFKAALEPGVLEMLHSEAYINKVRKDPDTPKWQAASATSLRNLKTLYDAGVKVGFGTDSGADPARIQGFDEHRELQLMVEAGLTPMQAILCATRDNAQLLGINSIGTLEPGKQADFLVLDGNPLDDIRNTTKLFAVWHAGQQIDPIAHEATKQNV